MEAANRDEARKCLLKAKSAYNKGAFSEAERLAKKSSRLCPSEEAEGQLGFVSTVFGVVWAESPGSWTHYRLM